MIPRLFWRDGGAAALWPCNQQSVFVLLSISLLQRADACIGCGKCEEACPQYIAIRESLEKACEELLK